MRLVTLQALLAVVSFAAGCANDTAPGQDTTADGLTLEIFVSEPVEVNVTSVLIMGPTEMMVVSAQGTRSAALRLADVVASKGRSLKYVYLTHPHLDHSQGAGILLERFPDAQFIATPEVAALQRSKMESDDQLARFRHRENAAVPSIPAADYDESVITIDGHTIEIWEDILGDGGIGEPHTALYVPTLGALMPSDAIYFDAHVLVANSTPESRAQAIRQIDGWLARDFEVVVPGHMPRGAPLTAERALMHTREYVRAYGEVMASQSSSDGVIREMLARYPGMPHESALIIATFLNFDEMERIREYLGTWTDPSGPTLRLR